MWYHLNGILEEYCEPDSTIGECIGLKFCGTKSVCYELPGTLTFVLQSDTCRFLVIVVKSLPSFTRSNYQDACMKLEIGSFIINKLKDRLTE